MASCMESLATLQESLWMGSAMSSGLRLSPHPQPSISMVRADKGWWGPVKETSMPGLESLEPPLRAESRAAARSGFTHNLSVCVPVIL